MPARCPSGCSPSAFTRFVGQDHDVRMTVWVTAVALAGALIAGCAAAPQVRRFATVEASTPEAVPVAPDRRIGALFVGGGDLHACTAAVLDSPAGDLILTAAHCLDGGPDASFAA